VSNVNLYSLQDVMKNDFPLLGFWFFTAAYLMANHDATLTVDIPGLLAE